MRRLIDDAHDGTRQRETRGAAYGLLGSAPGDSAADTLLAGKTQSLHAQIP